MTIDQAITLSSAQSRIVTIHATPAGATALVDQLVTEAEDYASPGDGVLIDAWGTDEDGSTWRVAIHQA